MSNYFSFSRLLYSPLSLLLPQHCLFCREKTGSRFALCLNCITDLPYNFSRCNRCSLPLEQTDFNSRQLCGNCLSHRYYYDQVYSPFLYSGEVRYLIRQLKYHHKLHYSSVLSSLFTETMASETMTSKNMAANLGLPQVLIPMPMHPARLRQRGFNQALELSRLLSRYFQLPMDSRSLVRTRNTALQAGLNSRERQKNVRRAFSVGKRITFSHAALIDDVMTTGSTVNEAARVLKTVGVRQVDIWCMARASAKH